MEILNQYGHEVFQNSPKIAIGWNWTIFEAFKSVVSPKLWPLTVDFIEKYNINSRRICR